jgi:SAM-dependent methyltransferase
MAFAELKQRHAAMWGAGPFERIAPTLEGMHNTIIDSLAPKPGEQWLDIGSGTGELAFLATDTSASIRGIDLSPALVETANRQAAERGLRIEFVVGDAEALDADDGSYDIVSSSVGAIFAPDHPRVAGELSRVVRSGGRLAMTAWTADGRIGDFFRTIAKYAPPPVAGAGNAMSWSDPTYAETLLEGSFELTFTYHDIPWRAETAEAMWMDISEAFGPIVVLLRNLDDERASAFRDELLQLFGDHETEDGVEISRPFVLISGVRR